MVSFPEPLEILNNIGLCQLTAVWEISLLHFPPLTHSQTYSGSCCVLDLFEREAAKKKQKTLASCTHSKPLCTAVPLFHIRVNLMPSISVKFIYTIPLLIMITQHRPSWARPLSSSTTRRCIETQPSCTDSTWSSHHLCMVEPTLAVRTLSLGRR